MEEDNRRSTSRSDESTTDEDFEVMLDRQRSPAGGPDLYVGWVFTLLGVGLLIPWNAFISAKPYFDARLCDQDGNLKLENVEVSFAFLYNAASVVSLATMLFLGSRNDDSQEASSDEDPGTPCSWMPACLRFNQSHTWYMVQVPLAIYSINFVVMTTTVLIPRIPPSLFSVIALSSITVSGMLAAFVAAGTVAAANSFPPRMGIGPYVSGQAVGGVAVALVNFVAATNEDASAYWSQNCEDEDHSNNVRLLVASEEESNVSACVAYRKLDWATFGYFALATLTIGACIVGFHWIEQKRIASSYAPVDDVPSENEEELVSESPRLVSDFPPSLESRIKMEQGHEIFADEEPVPSDQSTSEDDETSTATVWNKVKGSALTIFICFLVTLAIFPAWTSTLRSPHQCKSHWRILNDLYVPLTFVVFNVCDLLGRLLAERLPAAVTRRLPPPMFMSLTRIVFFPLFLLCKAQTTGWSSWVIPSDAMSFLIQASFGFTNGFLISQGFLQASQRIPSDSPAKMQERSSEILNLAIAKGLLAGSILSFCYTNVATGSWKF